nr:MAG TPA: hypothetical protein [Caudoviricetes sp.]
MDKIRGNLREFGQLLVNFVHFFCPQKSACPLFFKVFKDFFK